jgi:serine/threonine protein kinase
MTLAPGAHHVPAQLTAISLRALSLQTGRSAGVLAGFWMAKLLARFVQNARAMTSELLADLTPDTLVGAYRIIREIGRGGMATVYEAQHSVLPRRAALKVMHGSLLRQPGMATRMVQEAAILEDLRHPGVVRVFDCNVLPDRRPWIAMELVQGETLADRIHANTTLPALEVANLIGDVADVLAAVHKVGVIHRDLKPDNLLITPGDHEYPLRLLDWGVARLGPAGRLTLDGLTPGTPVYMSPEQTTGRNIAAPCDIYSLGVIAYEALTGDPPFDGRTLAEVVCLHLTGVPRPLRESCNAPIALCDLVERMLGKDPAQRPTAVEARQLARAIAAEMSPAYEEIVVTGGELIYASDPAMPPRRQAPIALDSEVLENGITEMLPVLPKPRWTPQIAQVPGTLTVRHGRRVIAPRAARDQIAGEFVASDKSR